MGFFSDSGGALLTRAKGMLILDSGVFSVVQQASSALVKFSGPTLSGLYALKSSMKHRLITHHVPSQAASYQADNELDSILNYPMYGALVEAFAIPGKLNTSAVSALMDIYPSKFKVIPRMLEVEPVAHLRNLGSRAFG